LSRFTGIVAPSAEEPFKFSSGFSCLNQQHPLGTVAHESEHIPDRVIDSIDKRLDREAYDKISTNVEASDEVDDVEESATDLDPQQLAQLLPYYVSTEFCTKLGEADVNRYYEMIPVHEGWPKGLAAEFNVTETSLVMYRRCCHDLFGSIERSFQALGAGGREPAAGVRQGHFLLQGPRGSGKSTALAAAVEFSRLCGAVVLYVPSCLGLIDGGMYHKNEDRGGWDTPDHARRLIEGLVASHGHRLERAPAPAGRPGSLRDVAEKGLARDEHSMEAALELIEGLRTTTAFPVVFALDDYNALYSHTGYYEAVSFKKRRMIMPNELRLANALRVLEQEPVTNGVSIVAPSYSCSISPRLRIPYHKGSLFEIPPFDEIELDRMAEFYTDFQVAAERPDGSLLLRMSAVTAGNAAEFRKFITLT